MNWTQDEYIRAFDFASEAHLGQYVPGSKRPYDTHFAKVTMEVIAALSTCPDCNGDLAVQCALLHDTVEDTDATVASIEEIFGQAVASGVSALTKNVDLPKPERMPDSIQRILSQAPEIAMVKLADRITNMAPPPAHWSKDKCANYLQEAALILEKLGPASPFLAQRLQLKMQAYQKWTR
jgi:(p)ppGpp synthase/HD superfamily hydrolase